RVRWPSSIRMSPVRRQFFRFPYLSSLAGTFWGQENRVLPVCRPGAESSPRSTTNLARLVLALRNKCAQSTDGRLALPIPARAEARLRRGEPYVSSRPSPICPLNGIAVPRRAGAGVCLRRTDSETRMVEDRHRRSSLEGPANV